MTPRLCTALRVLALLGLCGVLAALALLAARQEGFCREASPGSIAGILNCPAAAPRPAP